MYTVTLSATGAAARGAGKRAHAVHIPESPWVVSAYGRPTEQNLHRFVEAWEKRARRRRPALRVTRAIILRRKGAPQGVVAMYGAPAQPS